MKCSCVASAHSYRSRLRMRSVLRLLMIDNYDSFTFNLVQYFQRLGVFVDIFRSHHDNLSKIEFNRYDYYVISPGPSHPRTAGISSLVLERACELKKPLLGVCLGHQVVGDYFGADICAAPEIMHGKISNIYHDGQDLFRDIESPFVATRYHSLVVAKDSISSPMKILAYSHNNVVMAIQHCKKPIIGIQFHPESVLTAFGMQILDNFVCMYEPNNLSSMDNDLKS